MQMWCLKGEKMFKSERKLTGFGKEVDERVRLAALIQLWQLGAAVQAEVVDAEAPLPADVGVQQSTLGNRVQMDMLTKKKH